MNMRFHLSLSYAISSPCLIPSNKFLSISSVHLCYNLLVAFFHSASFDLHTNPARVVLLYCHTPTISGSSYSCCSSILPLTSKCWVILFFFSRYILPATISILPSFSLIIFCPFITAFSIILVV